MKDRKAKGKENYLERKPARASEIRWTADEKGNVTLDVENKGVFNQFAQKFLKKPEVTHVHLDEIGSFVWPLLDGQTDILSLGTQVRERFGEKAEPLYERLAKYFQVLESYRFIAWK